MALKKLKAPESLKIDFCPSPKQYELWKLLQPECPLCGGEVEQMLIGYDANHNPRYKPYCKRCNNQNIPQLILGGGAAGGGKSFVSSVWLVSSCIRFPDIRAGLRRSPLSVVFSDPQIAMVGSSLRELNQKYSSCGCFEIGEVSFEDQGRSRVMLRNKGILRVYGEHGTGRFLGAEMMGPNVEHIAHLLAWAHQQQMTVSQMLDMPFYHPVVEEGLRTALRDLNAKLHLGPEMVKRCLDCGPGA